MSGCPVTESSRERMLQQETSAVQRWIDGMTEQGVNGWKMTEVGDDQVGLQYGLAGSDMVERDHALQHAIRHDGHLEIHTFWQAQPMQCCKGVSDVVV